MSVKVTPELVKFHDGKRTVYLHLFDDGEVGLDEDGERDSAFLLTPEIIAELNDYLQKLHPTPSILAPLAEEVD